MSGYSEDVQQAQYDPEAAKAELQAAVFLFYLEDPYGDEEYYKIVCYNTNIVSEK